MDPSMVEQGFDYSFLPGEEDNPLMESTLHVDWGLVLVNSVRHTRADSNDLVTGNVAFALSDGGTRTAPDVMVVPGRKGQEFGCYEPGPDGPLPSVCVEIVSPSNTSAEIVRRSQRLLRLGVGEVYVLDPRRQTVVQVELDAAGELVESSAIGKHSEGLSLSFVLLDGKLAVCCPAGRVVAPGDDPFGWLATETTRADRAESRAEQAEARLVAMEAELADMRRRLAEPG